jgi:hypothetical protein
LSDYIGLALMVLVLCGALCGMARLGRAPAPISSEEFERRVQEARGTTRAGALAGMHALQKLLAPKAAEAIEVQRDLRAGYYDEAGQYGKSAGDGADVWKSERRAEGEGEDSGDSEGREDA